MSDKPASDIAEGPVLSLVTKRLRALRKKYSRILQMEDSVAQGKVLNKEQEDVLRSKPSVSVAIDELEKLRLPLAAAVADEIRLASSAAPSLTASIYEEEEKQQNVAEIETKVDRNHSVVEDLLNLLYFGTMFDVRSQSEFTSTMLTRTHERGCSLTYDYVSMTKPRSTRRDRLGCDFDGRWTVGFAAGRFKPLAQERIETVC